jgi:hypothetical protein
LAVDETRAHDDTEACPLRDFRGPHPPDFTVEHFIFTTHRLSTISAPGARSWDDVKHNRAQRRFTIPMQNAQLNTRTGQRTSTWGSSFASRLSGIFECFSHAVAGECCAARRLLRGEESAL